MKRAAALVLLTAASCASPSVRKGDEAPVTAIEEVFQANSPALVSAVFSTNPADRARAAVALGRIQTPACLDPLFALAGDADADVRRRAAFALGQHGWKPEFSAGREPEILSKLEPLLTDPDRVVRLAAIEAIGKIGMERVAASRLRDSDPELRAEAILAVYRARLVARLRAPKATPAEVPQETIDRLRELVGDASEPVRRNLAYFFARVKDLRGAEIAKTLSKDPSPWVRFFAVAAIGKCGDPAGAEAAVPAMSDPEYLVRLAAVQSLGALKLATMIPPSILKDPSFHVREAMANAFLESEGDDTPLDTLAADSNMTVRCAAHKAIAKRRREWAAKYVNSALADPSWRLRKAAIESLGELSKDWAGGEKLILGKLDDPDEAVRAAVIESLGQRQSEKAYETIVAALKREKLVERATAVEVLKERKEPDVLAHAAACYQDCADRKWIEVREALVDLFASKEGEEATGLLHVAMKDPAPSVAAKARRALDERGVKDLPPVATPEKPGSPHAGLRFTRNPIVVMETTRGVMEIECLAAEAPVHVANFVGLVKKGFYNELFWHRVVPAFVIQGGDPMGNGWGDAGYSIRAEINPVRYERGTLGMPRSDGFDTGSCQLFFTHLPTPHLDGQYTVFGRVVKGLDVIDHIEVGDRIERATVRE